MHLQQGSMTVWDYTTKFLEKSRFTEYYVATEARKVERYIFGLNFSIRGYVMAMKPETFTAAVDAVETTERDRGRDTSNKGLGKRKWEGPPSDYKRTTFPKFDSRSLVRFGERPCSKCKRVHQGDCKPEFRTCYKRGKPGHVIMNCPLNRFCSYCNSPHHLQSDCPQMKSRRDNLGGNNQRERKEISKPEQPRAKGRAFKLTTTEAEEIPDVVTGIFRINSIHAKVLFDSGANRSFMSPSFVTRLDVKPKVLDCAFMVEIANGSQIPVRKIFDNCFIDIEGCGIPIQLFPMTLNEFDVVVGIDWLAENQASIVCNKKLINIVLLEKGPVVIYGDNRNRQSCLISMLKAVRVLLKVARVT